MPSERSRVTLKGSGLTPRSAERVRGAKAPVKAEAEKPAAKATTKPVTPAPAKPGPVITPVKPTPAAKVAEKPAPATAAGATPGPVKPAPKIEAAKPAPKIEAAKPAPVAKTEAPAKVEPKVEAKAEAPVAKPAAAPAVAAAPAKPAVVPAPVAAAPVVSKKVEEPVAPAPVVKPIDPAAVAAAVAPVMEGAMKRVEAAVQHVDKEVDRRVGALESKLAELLRLQAELVARPVAQIAPQEPTPQTMDDELDQIARTMKRAFVDSFERSADRVALPLVKVQRYLEEIARRATTEAQPLAEHLNICVQSLGAVLTDLGVESFEAERNEAFDPVIHQAVGDASRDDIDANAVASSVAQGFRSARGQVLLPALVKVNRR